MRIHQTNTITKSFVRPCKSNSVCILINGERERLESFYDIYLIASSHDTCFDDIYLIASSHDTCFDVYLIASSNDIYFRCALDSWLQPSAINMEALALDGLKISGRENCLVQTELWFVDLTYVISLFCELIP